MAHACYVCNYAPVPDGEGAECPHCHRLQYGTGCPHCGQQAPTIIRGLKVFCSACGRERGALAGGMPMNVVGQPARIGGALARFAGWGTIFIALIMALSVGFITAFLATPLAGLLAGGLLAAMGIAAGALMLSGGTKLKDAGKQDAARAREQAVFGLAANRGGSLTATDVATALNMPVREADAMLTDLAREGTRVGLEVDGGGVVHYIFNEVRLRQGAAARPAGQVRVEPAGTGVRVDAQGAPAASGDADRDAVKAQVDREWQQMQDRNRAR